MVPISVISESKLNAVFWLTSDISTQRFSDWPCTAARELYQGIELIQNPTLSVVAVVGVFRLNRATMRRCVDTLNKQISYKVTAS